MHTESLQTLFASSPAVRLVRSPHASWIVEFLNQQFKLSGQIVRPHSELVTELDVYLTRFPTKVVDRSAELNANPSKPAESYLSTWCSPSTGWLKRFIDESSTEPCYQLTAEFEIALAFVEKLARPANFIGTESRLRTILDLLDKIVAGTASDPQVRLQQLQRQRDQLDAEIAELKERPTAQPMNPTQVRERFELAAQQLQQLKSEFREVEDRFKTITRKVQQKVLAAAESRGEILQFALNSEDLLKNGDQGQSFFEFLRLLHSPNIQERVAELVSQLGEVKSLANVPSDLVAFQNMVPALVLEAEKILRTTQHLSATLRRLLDARSTRHHQQLAQVLREIMSHAASRAEQPPGDVGIQVQVELEMQSAMDRPFWAATEPFDEVVLQPVGVNHADQAASLEQLVALERLDWREMRQNISVLTAERGEVDFADLLERYPAKIGSVEILGYLQIAFDDGHRVDRMQSVTLPASQTGIQSRTLNVPKIVFLPRSRRNTVAASQHQRRYSAPQQPSKELAQ